MTPTDPTDAQAGTDTQQELRSLGDILDALDAMSEERKTVSVEDILEAVGDRSFSPIILVPALLLVSPLSGIFGLPTIGATFIFLITIQKLLGRPHVWVPAVLKRREVKAERFRRAVNWLRRPSGWIDRRTKARLTVLVTRPARMTTLLFILAICLVIPALEILPFVTSVFATAIAFFAISLMARDGLFTLLGYIWTAGAVVGIAWMLTTGLGLG